MPWKDGWVKRNPGLKYPLWGFCIIIGLMMLALTFGPDEVREIGRDALEAAGIVGSKTTEGVEP